MKDRVSCYTNSEGFGKALLDSLTAADCCMYVKGVWNSY